MLELVLLCNLFIKAFLLANIFIIHKFVSEILEENWHLKRRERSLKNLGKKQNFQFSAKFVINEISPNLTLYDQKKGKISRHQFLDAIYRSREILSQSSTLQNYHQFQEGQSTRILFFYLEYMAFFCAFEEPFNLQSFDSCKSIRMEPWQCSCAGSSIQGSVFDHAGRILEVPQQ